MKYTNYKVIRNQIRTLKRTSTTELLAETKEEALEIITKQLKEERAYPMRNLSRNDELSNDYVISIDEDLTVEEVK